jgi:hypothetical protein
MGVDSHRYYVLADARSIARMIRFVILVTSSANANVLHAMTHVSARIAAMMTLLSEAFDFATWPSQANAPSVAATAT